MTLLLRKHSHSIERLILAILSIVLIFALMSGSSGCATSTSSTTAAQREAMLTTTLAAAHDTVALLQTAGKITASEALLFTSRLEEVAAIAAQVTALPPTSDPGTLLLQAAGLLLTIQADLVAKGAPK